MLVMIWVFIYVLFLHWVADFVLQTRWMADNKSKNLEALILHVFIYACTLFVGMLCLQYSVNDVSRFAIINFIIHICVDAITSRCTKWALEKKNMHQFFAIIGFDQFLHAATLLLTTLLLLGKP